MANSTNPLFGENKFKLGVFGPNLSGGCAMTVVEEATKLSWQTNLEIANLVDAAGFEAIVPVSRWKGFPGPSHFQEASFDTYTWAAGIGNATKHSAVFTTSNVPTIHPIVAAKQVATIDHITGGRFALNVVCGWYRPELEMFGTGPIAHDDRYDYAAEWVEIVRRLWTCEEGFDYEGRYFSLKGAVSKPHPVQRPCPPIMNAGGSSKGLHFSAKYADICFIPIKFDDLDQARAQIVEYRRVAREEYGREIQVWISAYCVQRDTEKEARDYWHHYVIEKGDDVAVDALVEIMTGGAAQPYAPGVLETLKNEFKAGTGGYPLIGTPDQIVNEMTKLSDIGIDGLVISWVDYIEGITAWLRDIMPRMVQAGLRA